MQVITGKSQTEALTECMTHQDRGLRFPYNEQIDEVELLSIILGPFHYRLEPAIN